MTDPARIIDVSKIDVSNSRVDLLSVFNSRMRNEIISFEHKKQVEVISRDHKKQVESTE